jgi:protein tyrosine phosphatase (PTP) superfamily phosphohydrolase (DUF442 family)
MRRLKWVENFLCQRAALTRYFTPKRGKKIEDAAPFYSMFDVGEWTVAHCRGGHRSSGKWAPPSCLDRRENEAAARVVPARVRAEGQSRRLPECSGRGWG